MKYKRSSRLLGLATLTVIAVGTGLLLFSAGRPVAEPMGLRGEGEADENPAARAEWELRRLRDPATGRVPEGIRGAELAFAATLPSREGSLYKSAGIADYGWTPRGPANVGGRTRAVALDVDNDSTILAGGASGGMWRSTNGGTSWTRTTLRSQLPAVSCIAQDTRPGKHGTWYYGTGEILGSSATADGAYYGGDGIFKSTDDGVSWRQIQSTVSNTPHRFDQLFDYVWKVAIDPSNLTQDEIYVATYGGIMRSINGGTSWSNVVIDATRYSAMCDVAVTDSGVVYATLSSDGGKGGIWRLGDGTTQTKITPPDWPAKVNRVVIGIAPSNQNVVYFLAETPGTGHLGFNFQHDSVWATLWKYTYVSGNGTGAGGIWENRSASLPSNGGSFGDYNPQTSYDMHVEASPTDENILFIGGTNLYRSTDAFATAANTTWIGGYRNTTLDSAVRLELEYPDHHPDQHLLLFSPHNPRVAYTGSDGGVHRTDDVLAPTVAWTPLNTGYLTTQFYTVSIDHATPGNDLIIGGLQDNGTWLTPTSDASAAWKWIGSGDGSFCAVGDGRRSVYVSKQQGKAYRVTLKTDGTLDQWTRVDPRGGRNYQFINPFVLDPANTDVMYLSAGNKLMRNSDLTQIPLLSSEPATLNWTTFTNPVLADTDQISAFGTSTAAPAHRLYIGTTYGHVYRFEDAATGDPTPVNVTATTFPKNANVAAIAVDPADAQRAVVVFSNYAVQSLFLTTDGGTTWAPISGNLEATPAGTGAGPSCRTFMFLHRGGGTVYLVGTSTGLYSTTNLNGMSTVWSLEGASTIGNMVVDMIDARQSDGYVAIGTHGSGVFSTTIAPLGVAEEGAAAAGLMLHAPAPNPVRSMARVSYAIPGDRAGEHLRLVMYDEAGRSVATLLDGTAARGEGTIPLELDRWPLVVLADGIYFLRLEVGNAAVVQAVRVAR